MRKMRTLPLPRYIEPASVDEGDTVRVTWRADDIEITRTGKVDRIRDTRAGKVFYTPNGNELFTFQAGRNARVTLLATSDKPQPTLFDMHEVV